MLHRNELADFFMYTPQFHSQKTPNSFSFDTNTEIPQEIQHSISRPEGKEEFGPLNNLPAFKI